MQYIKCEAGIAQSPEEQQNLEAFYRKAFNDYYSKRMILLKILTKVLCNIGTEIALMYVELSTQMHFKEIWDEVLGVYGLHCMKGREYFSKYRMFVKNKIDMR